MTCVTCGMSSPRAATSVATMMGALPLRNCLSAHSRSCCVRSPWMDVLGKPCLLSQSSSWSAPRFVSVNTNVRPCTADTRSMSMDFLSSYPWMYSTCCVMRLCDDPTRPTVRNM